MTFINATQFAGIVAFGIAALCAGNNWRSARTSKRQWGVLSVITALLATECWLGLRHRVHALATDWLVARNLYDMRAIPQKYLIAVLALVGCALVFFVTVRPGKQPSPLRSAWLATILSLVLFLIESVSLHGFDTVLYQPLGPIAVIGWLWILLGSTIAFFASA